MIERETGVSAVGSHKATDLLGVLGLASLLSQPEIMHEGVVPDDVHQPPQNALRRAWLQGTGTDRIMQGMDRAQNVIPLVRAFRAGKIGDSLQRRRAKRVAAGSRVFAAACAAPSIVSIRRPVPLMYQNSSGARKATSRVRIL